MRHTGRMVVVVCVMLAGCGESPPASKEIDFGTLTGSVYRNDYFGMTITLPADWSIQDEESRKKLMDLGAEVVAGDDTSLKSAIKASELTTVNLLTAFQYPLGTPVTYNPNVACVAERVRDTPGITTSEDYFFHAKKFFEASQMEFTFPQEYGKETIGGQEFGVMYVDLSAFGQTVHQKYYAQISKGYALTFIVSYTTDEELTLVQGILDQVTFE